MIHPRWAIALLGALVLWSGHAHAQDTPQPARAADTSVKPPIQQSSAGGAPVPTLGKKGRLLLDEPFAGHALPKGWTVKSGQVRVDGGVLRANQTRGERLCLFNCVLPMQDMAVQIDFKFDGGRGIHIGVNPSPGELNKHGHLYSVMITPRMWNITEHNDKNDRTSVSKVLMSAPETFEQGKWYTMLLENKGSDVLVRIEGKKPLKATSKDFRVKKPGIEFRVLGRDEGQVVFDNLRVWELK
jgi:hypothetical protein